MATGRFKDVEWNLPKQANGAIQTWELVQVAVLMDIRDELKRLNGLLHCPNFVGIPAQLRHMEKAAKRANTTAAKRRRAK